MKRILTILTLCVLASRLNAQVSFASATNYTVGNDPRSVVAADVNGDGNVDLIAANQGDNTLTVLINNGSGRFVTAGTYAVDSRPFSVAVADVNNDGKIDLISANYGANTLTVLTNNGSGGFALAYSLPVGGGPEYVTTADVNGDGKVDLISANSSDFTLTVLTNTGHGTFVSSSVFGVGSGVGCVVAADVNGDGYVDLITGNQSDNTLTVVTNNGSGGFVTAGTYTVGNDPWSVWAADVNGDGKPDLMSANYNGNTLSVLTNNGSGRFVNAGTYPVGANPRSVIAANVSGGRFADLICVNAGSDNLSVLTNNGAGGYVLGGTYALGSYPFTVTAADVNRDGKPDLISVSSGSGMLSVSLNTSIFGPPIITTQPQSQTAILGSSTNLSVLVIGNPPLKYQWRFYGTNISGATNSTLAFTSLQLTNAGIYSVIVSNNLGFAGSSNAILQVLPPGAPSIQINNQVAVGTMTFIGSAQLTITGGFPGGYIFYTLDGSVPSANSTLYTGAFTVSNSVTVQAMSLSANLSNNAYSPPVQVRITTAYSLQTSVIGSGTIAVNPTNGPYLSNSVVVLTAIPATNWLFVGWTNGATGNQNPLSLTMNGPQNVQAIFAPIPLYSLQTSVIGSGSIAVNPTNGPYLSNSIVVLTAIPATNWLFVGWTNGATGNQNPLSLTMDGPMNVQAVFTQSFPVSATTPGGGSVTVNGMVIAPNTYYPTGGVLSVAVTPSSGWTFLGWQGSANGTNNPLSVTVNGPKSIQAIFGTVVGTNVVGGGEIVLNQPSLVPFGTIVTASAVPNLGKYFVTWSGAASGTNAPTKITVTSANPTVSGLFTTLPGGTYSLGVVVMGNGSVGISPQQNYYSAGATVTLSATPTPGAASFYGWTQGASGTNSPIQVLMNSNQIVQANFGAQPIVNISPLNLFAIVGSNAVLTANAAGLPPLSYQWQDSEGVIAGQTNAILTIFNVQPTNSDTYSVVVSNSFGSVTSAVANITVVFPPSIATQPTNLTVAAGASLLLSVTASGTPPLSYQWQNSSGPILAATSSNLMFNPALTNYSDNYTVVVSNPYGVMTSEVATAFVYLPVSILIQPASLAVPYAASATFSVTANGFPAPNSYQWMFNGTNLVGANSSTLTINNVRFSNTGEYQVQVGNGYTTTNSQIAMLNVSPSITSPFTGATAIWGGNAIITVGAVGSGTLTYQWYFNGVPIGGATLPSLSFSSIQFSNAGLYSMVVSSPYGSVTNIAAQIIVDAAGISLGFYPGLTISGVAGQSYIIQSSTNLPDINAWVTQTNLTLTSPVELWIDTNVDASSPFNSKTFYKILPGH